jgi:phage terminase small subunit
MPKLTPKRQDFVERFCVHVIASKAARKAGFSAKTADRVSLEILWFSEVQQLIAECCRSEARWANDGSL